MAARPLATRRWRRRPAPWSPSDASRCVRGAPSAVTFRKSTPCTGALNRGVLINLFSFSFFFCSIHDFVDYTCVWQCCMFLLLFVLLMCYHRMHESRHATPPSNRPPGASIPSAELPFGAGAPSRAIWLRSMPCIGPWTPGTSTKPTSSPLATASSTNTDTLRLR